MLRSPVSLLFAALAPTLAWGGGGEVPFDVGAFRSSDFPAGAGFLRVPVEAGGLPARRELVLSPGAHALGRGSR